MPTTITGATSRDIRFPTSLSLAGSDAMNPDPDYSAAYVVLHTDHTDGIEGHGLAFTIGRGNELCVAAIEALAPMVVGRTLESLASDLGGFWNMLTGESQLRTRRPSGSRSGSSCAT
jgi:L-fuconate dehydratase